MSRKKFSKYVTIHSEGDSDDDVDVPQRKTEPTMIQVLVNQFFGDKTIVYNIQGKYNNYLNTHPNKKKFANKWGLWGGAKCVVNKKLSRKKKK